MKYFTCVIILFLSIVSCKTPPAIDRTPLETVSKDGYHIGIYDYDNFAKFLQAENDTTYVFNFWATWCKPCVEELPYFQQLLREHEHQGQKVRFIFVSLDDEDKTAEKLISFLLKKALKGEQILLKQKGMARWIPKINPNWTGSLPATLIYNKKKRGFYEQSFEYNELKSLLQQYL